VQNGPRDLRDTRGRILYSGVRVHNVRVRLVLRFPKCHKILPIVEPRPLDDECEETIGYRGLRRNERIVPQIVSDVTL